MIDPSGNVAPEGSRPFCSTPNAVAFMLTRIRGTCALDPLRMPLVFPARPGKDVYEPNGSVWVTRVKNAESEVMPPVPAVVGDVGDVIGASPLLQEMQTARPRNALRRRTNDVTLVRLDPAVDNTRLFVASSR